MKKGQFKIQQMAFMLIAVTILFVFAGMFALSFKLAGLKGSVDALAEKNAQLLVARLANSPEFACGNVFDYGDAFCVDGDKVMALKQSERIYNDFWDVSNIQIRKVNSGNAKICTPANYPDCGVLKVREGDEGDFVSNFVVLCWKDSYEGEVIDKCEISRLMISYEPVE